MESPQIAVGGGIGVVWSGETNVSNSCYKAAQWQLQDFLQRGRRRRRISQANRQSVIKRRKLQQVCRSPHGHLRGLVDSSVPAQRNVLPSCTKAQQMLLV